MKQSTSLYSLAATVASLTLQLLVSPSAVGATSSIWSSSTVPGGVDGGPDSSVELGVKFRSDVSGNITGIRFYKATANTGTHVGNLWSSSGTLLATGTFTGETASGWQQMSFTSPVAITAGTVYVASYHCGGGHYSADLGYFATGVDNAPLHALADGVSGPDGIYAYGTSSAFPTLTWNSANYWVDVVFQSGPAPTLTSIAVTPANPSIAVGATQQFTATGTYSDSSTQNLTSQVTWSSSSTTVATINAAGLANGAKAGSTTISATLSGVTGSTGLTVQSTPLSITTTSLPGAALGSSYSASVAASGGTLPYTWSISAGALPSGLTLNPSSGAITGTPTSGGTFNFTVKVSDVSSPAQNVTKALSIVVNSVFTIWPASTVPGLADGGKDSSVEVGVKFRSDVSGNITGIRFYKATANTGAHVGNLWTSTGTLLASVTFTGETASGWQQMNFSSPVAITAGTTYVASYHCGTGHYSADLNYFASAGVDNPPLHALANGVSANGVFGYGTGNVFPASTWNSANYWVDVVFQSGPAPTLTSIAVTPANPTIAVGATQQFTATGTYSDNSTKDLTAQVTWSSSDNTVATVSASGLASGVKAGTTTISASLSGVTGSTGLTVQSAPLSITTGSLPGAAVGSSYSASVAASGGTLPYTWSISAGALPPGITLNAASGALSGTPTTGGTFSLTVKVTDVSSPAQTATKALSIVINSVFTIWPSSTVPGLVDAGQDSSVELGVKFRSDVPGNITGIRFYKATANTGTHVGNLWSSTGTLLASVTFTGESASGWQQMNFSSPVAITAGTTYVASYHCNGGHYSGDVNYFASAGVDNPPLHALATGVSPDGVYAYGTSSIFPNSTFSAANYWVDVILQSGALPTLVSISVTPANPTITAGGTQQFTATGTYSDNSTKDLTSQVTWSSSSTAVATINGSGLASGLAGGTSTISAILSGVTGSTTLTVQSAALSISTTSLPGGTLGVNYAAAFAATGGTTPYTWSISAGSLPPGVTLTPSTGALGGSPTSTGTFNFTAKVTDTSNPVKTASKALSITITSPTGDPILVLTNGSNPFTAYYAEVLSAEGMNEFDVKDISSISAGALGGYDVALLGEMTLNPSQVSILSNWVYSGGKLVAMRPDKQLSGLLGLTDLGTTLQQGYLLVNTSSGPGVGIVGETIQFHGTADNYGVNGGTVLATLFSGANTTTGKPAVTQRSVGPNGGQAAAFMFDLARSIIYTRQGNPAWSGQERDGITPIRSDDLFFGNASFDPQADWVDLNKVEIPQADEQQRLLANMLIYMDANKRLLPRFWYFPHGYQAVVVMTGDDHAGTYGGSLAATRFNQYLSLSAQGGSVDDWTVPRCTAYIFTAPNSCFTNNSQAAAYDAAGFEIGVHLNTDCVDFTPASLETYFASQLGQFTTKFPSLPHQTTHRIHCIVWSDYSTAAQVSLAHGIRLETSYYYWPDSWILDRPGLFTGSGIPMRFATAQGNTLDIYQAPTQMTDESGQSYPSTCDALLDAALGPQGYYGAFVANIHTDAVESQGDDILFSAQSRGVPIISARQLLKWLDARNASSIGNITWNNNTETFSVQANANAKGLQTMVPIPAGYTVGAVSFNGASIPYSVSMVKGIPYAVFSTSTGSFQVGYVTDTTPPSIISVSPTNGSSSVSAGSPAVSAFFTEPIAPATLNGNSFSLRDSANNLVPAVVTYNPNNLSAQLVPTSALGLLKTYTAKVLGGTGGVTDLAGNPMSSSVTWSFTTRSNYTIWSSTTVPGVQDAGQDSAVELGVKFKSDIAGTITGIRFFKSAANTGTHVVNLWTAQGALMASATAVNETPSGWQEVNFSAPVSIAANTVYVASYHVSSGHYSDDPNYFGSEGVDSLPLHALADGVSGGNGIYRYGSTSLFPNQTFGAGNYWVDVMFKP